MGPGELQYLLRVTLQWTNIPLRGGGGGRDSSNSPAASSSCNIDHLGSKCDVSLPLFCT